MFKDNQDTKVNPRNIMKLLLYQIMDYYFAQYFDIHPYMQYMYYKNKITP